MASKQHFYRRAGGFLCVAQGNLEDFVGDALATSTNRRLEGALRRNWWGFIGRRSADAALHEKAGPSLLHDCKALAQELPFGTVLATSPGSALSVRHVLHTAVPSHPAGRDPRPMPSTQAGDFATTPAEAMSLLQCSYCELLRCAAALEAKSLACPAIGCGIRGYPMEEAAEIGLRLIVEDVVVPYVEVRIWDWVTFKVWQESCCKLGLESCNAADVMGTLWDGETLENWQKKRITLGSRVCPLM
mmetsp:Transcript_126526/g.252861  ORF Transcript_126526/g.252861 Transcript_126526/m.252861 type:complete len:245 (+) Transcript_126526:57-791(+)